VSRGDAVLGVIKVDADGFGGQALTALWVVSEELPQVQVPYLRVMGLKSLPCRPLSEWRKGCRHTRYTSNVCLSFRCRLRLGETETFRSLRSYYDLFPAVFLSPKTLTLAALKRQWVWSTGSCVQRGPLIVGARSFLRVRRKGRLPAVWTRRLAVDFHRAEVVYLAEAARLPCLALWQHTFPGRLRA